MTSPEIKIGCLICETVYLQELEILDKHLI